MRSRCLLTLMFGFSLALGAQSAEPPVIVPASANKAAKTLTLKKLAARPVKGDLTAGLLVNDQYASLRTVPELSLTSASPQGQDWLVTLEISGLIPFGDSSVPVLYKGVQVETIRLHKGGLVLQARSDGAVTQQEGQPLLLVLENSSDSEYSSVSARLRFQDVDVCSFTTEFQAARPATDTAAAADCGQADHWATFQVPRYARVSLRALPVHGWFLDRNTGFARSARRKGTLTLRFTGSEGPAVISEQVLPIELDLEPGTWSLARSLLRVAAFLLLGAGFSLLLRTTIPNSRRSRALKDQLTDVAKSTRSISDEVESSLRVQLRVERLALDSLRKSVISFGPNFSDIATRVEQGVATLKRRIEYTRRLDAASIRKRILIADDQAPPTRVNAIERQLTAVSEALKHDQFSEQDWVFIQQRIEAADKLLGEVSEEEKSAFEATLIQRWKALSQHFGVDGSGALKVPEGLKGMEACFPPASSLPKTADDPDGAQWIKSIGLSRADLQISALELLRDFEFLARAANDNAMFEERWKAGQTRLKQWLPTPALGTLADARRLIRELSEGIDAPQIMDALRANEATIDMDPQFIGTNEKLRLAIRFHQPRWNSSAARQEIVCEWEFRSLAPQAGQRWWRRAPETPDPAATMPAPGVYREHGWEIYHYFEGSVSASAVSVSFYYDGKPVLSSATDPAAPPLQYTKSFPLRNPRTARQISRDRWERFRRLLFESGELLAVLLVPLAALAVSTTNEGSTGHWWELISLGFGSETIRNVLSGKQDQTPGKSGP